MSKETLVDKSRQNTASSLSHETPCHSETRWHRAGHWCIFPQDDQPTAWHLWNSSSSVSMAEFWFLCCCTFGECSTSLGIKNWSEDALAKNHLGWAELTSWGVTAVTHERVDLCCWSFLVMFVSWSSWRGIRTWWLEKQSNWHGQNHGGDLQLSLARCFMTWLLNCQMSRTFNSCCMIPSPKSPATQLCTRWHDPSGDTLNAWKVRMGSHFIWTKGYIDKFAIRMIPMLLLLQHSRFLSPSTFSKDFWDFVPATLTPSSDLVSKAQSRPCCWRSDHCLMFCEPKRLEHSSHLFWRLRLNPWSYGVQLLSLHAQNAVSLELESDGGLVVLHSGILQHRTATTGR